MAAGGATVPVVEVSYRHLAEMTNSTVQTIQQRIPHLGLDIEYEDGDMVRVEYSPNRPDYSTEYGIGLGLQGILEKHTGMIPLYITPSDWSIHADNSVKDVRGAVTGVVATGGDLDEYTIKQIISMQEDIHQGLGRRRQKVAIGLHDASMLTTSISYTTVSDRCVFVPLESTKEMSIHDILSSTKQGRQYGHLISGDAYPVIMDDSGVVSMPPVINSARTAITKNTKDIFVDITGHHTTDVERALSIVCITLQAAGFKLQGVSVSGAKNRTPPLQSRQMSIHTGMINDTLGLDMTPEEATACIRRSRLDAHPKGDAIQCTIPPYRFDVIGVMDIVEEAALGYGIDRIAPTPPVWRRPGVLHHTSTHVATFDRIMTGLGYTQVINPGLTRMAAEIGIGSGMRVANPKSEAHTILRTTILSGLLETLGRNIHEPYPHMLYETGRIFGDTESLHMGCVTAHKAASYSEIKSVLYALLRRGLGLDDVTTPRCADTLPYMAGRLAHISVGGVVVGVLGEIDQDVLRRFRLRDQSRVAAFEVDVELIFDHTK